MKALRVQVERVVRPIRASNLRKDRMREELLSHLTRLFDEEMVRSSNAQFATAEAIRRFGDAPSLSSELQSSVPWLERWAFLSFPKSGPIRRRPGESPVRYVLRSNGWGLGLAIAGCMLLALVVTIASGQRPHRVDEPAASQLLIFMMAIAAIQFATMIGEGLLAEGIRRALERHAAASTAVERRRAIRRIVAYAAMSSAVLGGAFAGLMISIAMFIPIPLITREFFWWITVGAAVLAVPFTMLQAWSWKASTRRVEDWDSLEFDEPRSA